MKSDSISYNFPFSHIYVEKQAADHPLTKEILGRFRKSVVIPIDHYKDVFNRAHQDFELQKTAPALILAKNEGESVFAGSPVCQDFGNDHFYYTSCARGCIFNCEYCFLRGMYGSGNVVIFVNLEDIFTEVDMMCKQHHMYLCVSYDTDLIALESLTGFVSKWSSFTESHEDLTIEIRTKSFRKDIYDICHPCERTIFAYTLSPQEVIDRYERKTSSLSDRLDAAAYAMSKGFPVRLCFDPIIYFRGWQKAYSELIQKVSEKIDLTKVKDVSVGSFRIPAEYMKPLRKSFPTSSICQFPYENRNGVFQYSEDLQGEMENTLVTLLQSLISKDRIYLAEF